MDFSYPPEAEAFRSEFRAWLDERGYVSVAQMKGSMSLKSVADPTAFERGNYIKIIEKYKAEYSLPV